MEKQRIFYIGTTQLPGRDLADIDYTVPRPNAPVTTRTPPPQNPSARDTESLWDDILAGIPVLANVVSTFVGQGRRQNNNNANANNENANNENSGGNNNNNNNNNRQSQDNTLLYVGLAVAGAIVFKSMKRK
jgi:hypothetical protein